eukprot:4308264-Amphidinium_carterae.1
MQSRSEFQQRNKVVETFSSKGGLTKRRARELEVGHLVQDSSASKYRINRLKSDFGAFGELVLYGTQVTATFCWRTAPWLSQHVASALV